MVGSLADMNSALSQPGKTVQRLCALSVLASLLLLQGCSPALDWRETNVSGGAVSTMFPCRPENRVRQVPLAGAKFEMHLSSCTASGSNFAVSHVDVGDPALVQAVLAQLQAIAIGNIGGASPAAPFKIAGLNANEAANRLSMSGTRADGSDIQAQAVFFSHGSVVYQATVVGARLDPDAADTFLLALRAL